MALARRVCPACVYRVRRAAAPGLRPRQRAFLRRERDGSGIGGLGRDETIAGRRTRPRISRGFSAIALAGTRPCYAGATTARKRHPANSCNFAFRVWLNAVGPRESGMGAAPYHVVRERDKWTIVVAGTAQIICETRKVAINTAQRAADLLREDRSDAASLEQNGQN